MADDMTLCVECGKPAQLNNRGEWLACHSCSPAVGPLCGDCMARHIGEHSLAAEYGYVDSPLSPALERIAGLEAQLAAIERALIDGEITTVGASFTSTADAVAETIAELRRQERELAALKARRCKTCKHWSRIYDCDFGFCGFWTDDRSIWHTYDDERCRNWQGEEAANADS